MVYGGVQLALCLLFTTLVLQCLTLVVKTDGPKSASWFEGFDRGESTYSSAGVPIDMSDYTVGAETRSSSILSNDFPQPYEWFHESLSNGGKTAVQTYFPQLSSGGKWASDSNGDWLELYTDASDGLFSSNWYSHLKSDSLDADFFDQDVNQLDYYGRTMYSTDDSSNTSLTKVVGKGELKCAYPGCTARTNFTVGNPTQLTKSCYLDVNFKVTDFDRKDGDRPEMVQYVSVNGALVSAACTPIASGCTINGENTFSCAKHLPITRLSKDRTFVVAAAITKEVDESAYNGDLLSGDAKVTCYVSNPASSPVRHAVPDPDRASINSAQLQVFAIGNTALKDCLDTFENALGDRLNWIESFADLEGMSRAFCVANTFPFRASMVCDAVNSDGCTTTASVTPPFLDFYKNQISSATVSILLTDTDYDDSWEREGIQIGFDGEVFDAINTPTSNPCVEQAYLFPDTYTQNELVKLVERTETVCWSQEFTQNIQRNLNVLRNDGLSLYVPRAVDDCPSQGHYVDGAAELTVSLKRDPAVNMSLLNSLLDESYLESPYS